MDFGSSSNDESWEDPAIEYKPVFGERDSLTDVTFVVEEQTLHFSKLYLRAVSPVFEQMFTSDFKEKDSSVIPLPGKKLKDVDIFLQNIHPVHAWEPLKDSTLEILLRLANEYQTDNILRKCKHHITEQIRTNSTGKVGSSSFGAARAFRSNLAPGTVLFYLDLCDRYDLKAPRTTLIELASQLSLATLESIAIYNALSEATKTAILRKRCQTLERKK